MIPEDRTTLIRNKKRFFPSAVTPSVENRTGIYHNRFYID